MAHQKAQEEHRMYALQEEWIQLVIVDNVLGRLSELATTHTNSDEPE